MRWYPHGIPYAEARAYGPSAVPELVAMLQDPSMEPHWTKVIWTLGCIGDPAAVSPLMTFLKQQRGEVSVDAFRGVLAVMPALGMIAQSGDREALSIVMAYTNSRQWLPAGLYFGYQRYRGAALGEVLSRTAIQGLAVSGRTEARQLLESMNHSADLRPDWRDNVGEALRIHERINAEGAARVFGGED